MSIHIGCAGLPPGMSRDKYFDKLQFLEFEDSRRMLPKAKTARKWPLPEGGLLAIHAPESLCYELSDSDELSEFAKTVAASRAKIVVFRTGADFSPSQSNRDKLCSFFDPQGPARKALGDTHLLWLAQGLWEMDSATALIAPLDVHLGVDPFAQDFDGAQQGALQATLSGTLAYMRVASGSTGGRRLGLDKLEFLAELCTIAESAELCCISFATSQRYRDALALAELIG